MLWFLCFKHIKVIFYAFSLHLISKKASSCLFGCTLHYCHGKINCFFEDLKLYHKAVPVLLWDVILVVWIGGGKGLPVLEKLLSDFMEAPGGMLLQAGYTCGLTKGYESFTQTIVLIYKNVRMFILILLVGMLFPSSFKYWLLKRNTC